jgi:ubiquinone/menaquinone biosynthesis C-methylase UbiE
VPLRLELRMICNSHSLIIRELFEKHGHEHQVAAKAYLLHEALQDWQVSILFKAGLKPHHDFLDIGCGWLRLGAALLPYLEEGRYHGIDATQVNLDIGREFLARLGIRQTPHLLCDAGFAFDKFGKPFDVVFCHAVFTHLSHTQIERCLAGVQRVMKPGGVGYFTFYLGNQDAERAQVYRLADGGTLDFSSAQVSLKYWERLFHRMKLPWKHLGHRGHPTGQHLIRVQFPKAASLLKQSPEGETVRVVTPAPSSRMSEADGRSESEASRYRRILMSAAFGEIGDLASLRSQLMGQGYCLIRNFCSLEDTKAIRSFWHRHPMAPGKKGYWVGRSNFAMHGIPVRNAAGTDDWPKVLRYECFFWNQPEHRLSYEVAWAANAVRNALQGLPLQCHLLPLYGYASTYRITRSDRGGAGVALHVDKRDATQPVPIQNSLLLSRPGEDYEGGGMLLSVKDGRRLNIFEAEAMEPGDLLVWDQQLAHEVPPVIKSDPRSPCGGFWRMLMPVNPIVARSELWKPGMVDLPDMPEQPPSLFAAPGLAAAETEGEPCT